MPSADREEALRQSQNDTTAYVMRLTAINDAQQREIARLNDKCDRQGAELAGLRAALTKYQRE